jgi:hypothetical protein
MHVIQVYTKSLISVLLKLWVKNQRKYSTYYSVLYCQVRIRHINSIYIILVICMTQLQRFSIVYTGCIASQPTRLDICTF